MKLKNQTWCHGKLQIFNDSKNKFKSKQNPCLTKSPEKKTNG